MDMFSDLLDPIIESVAFQTASLALGLVAFVSAVALVFWLFRDARRRGSFSIFWGLIGTAALIAGVVVGFGQTDWGFITVGAASLVMVLAVLLAYTLLRPAEFAADAQERELSQRLLEAELETHACPSCGAGIEVDFLICPSCNVTLRRPCDYCARPIKTDWSTCPYCLARKGQGETRASAAPAKRKTGASPAAGRRRTTAKPAANNEDADDLDLSFDTAKATTSKRTSTGSRSSSGRRSSSSSSDRKSDVASSTYKD
jgi:uncharacterized membrane protein YgcG